MSDLKERFSLADRIESPELWSEARRRAITPDAASRSASWQPDRGKRAAAALVAFAVFAGAAVFAWNLSHPELAPKPRPEPAVDLASELPIGWSELPAPPEVRSGAATAWTGSQLLVWGGHEYTGYSDDSSQDDGFVYDARSRTWSPLPDTPLEGRSDPTVRLDRGRASDLGRAIRGGRQQRIILRGRSGLRPFVADMAIACPMPRSMPGRRSPSGPARSSSCGGARIGPPDAWTAPPTTRRPIRWRPIAEAPLNITDGSAVWSGDEMLVVGAALDGNNHAETRTAIGEAYDPETDAWRELPASDLSPQAMTAVWLNGELVAWDYDLASEAYDPGVDRWRPLAAVPLEFSECRPQSVSTSRIVVGDFCGGTVVFTAEEQTWRQAPLPPCCSCCRTTELVAAGDVVFSMSHAIAIESLEAADRRMFVYNPRPVANPDTTVAGTEPEPFFPATERNGDQLHMPVTFPDGSAATLVFPSELGLEELGVQPDVTYQFRGRYQGPILFLHGRDVPLGDFVDTSGGSTLVDTSGGGIEVWPAKAGERSQARAWIRHRAPHLDRARPDRGHGRRGRGRRCARAPGSRRPGSRSSSRPGKRSSLADSARRADRSSGSAIPARRRTSCRNSTRRSSLGSADCGGFETEVSSDYGAACLGNGNVFASIYGLRGGGFVARVIEGLEVEDFRAE